MRVSSFKKATIEISNICNAQCKWCTTGRENRECTEKANFMTSKEFVKGIDYMLKEGIIDATTEIELYNWGEPFLNPEINHILKEVVKRKLKYHLSTNGSKVVEFDDEVIRNMDHLMFSLSGFSQETYGKIHGFDIEKIKMNILKIANQFRRLDCIDKVEINFHVYQFNIHEIDAAREFFENMGIRFVPRYAYFNDFELFNDYLTGDMELEVLREASKDMFLYYYDEAVKEVPKEYYCPQYDYLILDHQFNIVPCCRLTTKENKGNLFNYTLDEIINLKLNMDECRKCKETGQYYIVHEAVPDPEEKYNWNKANKIKKISNSKFDWEDVVASNDSVVSKIYYDTGSGFNEEEVLYCKTDKVANEFSYEFSLPIETKCIRFDPLEGRGCVLKNLQIVTNNGVIAYENSNGIDIDEYIVFTNTDPQICVNFNSQVTVYVRISVKIYAFNDVGVVGLLDKFISQKKLMDEMNENKMKITSLIGQLGQHESYQRYLIDQQEENKNRELGYIKKLEEDKYNIQQVTQQLEEFKMQNRKLEVEKENIAEMYTTVINSKLWKTTNVIRRMVHGMKRGINK